MWKPTGEDGQGLVEYALILTLVAVAVIVILSLLGPQLGNKFCQVATDLNDGVQPGPCQQDTVAITDANYISAQQQVKLKATYDGGYDAGITLTASPGGAMSQQGNHYALTVTGVSGCPCTITVTASDGNADTVTVN